MTTVYARRSALERLELCEDLENIEVQTNTSWLVGGDLNTYRLLQEILRVFGNRTVNNNFLIASMLVH